MMFNEHYFRVRGMLEDNGHLHQIAVRVKQFFSGTVLDVGCGLGFVVKHLLDEGINAEGVDISPVVKDKAVTDKVKQADFRSVDAAYDTLIASKLLQCLSDEEVKEFSNWAITHCKKHLLILNSSGSGEVEYTRLTDTYRRWFTDWGWFIDVGLTEKLTSATNWDCLVLASDPANISQERPFWNLGFLNTSFVVDCWSGGLGLFFEHLRGLLYFGGEVVLVNVREDYDKFLKFVNKPFSPYELKGTPIRITLVDGEYRSTAVALQKGLEKVTSRTCIFLQSVDRVNQDFIIQSLRVLVQHPKLTFVGPPDYFVAESLPTRSTFPATCDLFNYLNPELAYPVPIQGGTLQYYRATSYPKLALSRKVAEIAPVIVARTEDLSGIHIDKEQLVFGVQDLVCELVYCGELGALAQHTSVVTCRDPKRFAEEEFRSSEERLWSRERGT